MTFQLLAREIQKCPKCGLEEAAGAYCTLCLTRTDASHRRPHTQGEKSPSRKRRRPSNDAQNSMISEEWQIDALAAESCLPGSIGCLPEVA